VKTNFTPFVIVTLQAQIKLCHVKIFLRD